MYEKYAKKHLFQKTGFLKTLRILYNINANKYTLTEKAFFTHFLKESYYNAYYRVKPDLIRLSLINVNNKTINLTEKGKEVYLLVERLINKVEKK